MTESFSLTDIEYNPDGWGPISLPAHLQDIPYAPFSKADKIGRISDWTNTRCNTLFHNPFSFTIHL